MQKIRFLTAGESHGQALTAIIEGLPAGFDIDENYINNELARRQSGYGRGERMKIEHDKVEILSGVRFGKTLGSPVALLIRNRDWENWSKIMSVKSDDFTCEKSFTAPRPGHADLAGAIKYSHQDLRNVLERASARKTAAETAVGAVSKQILEQFGIKCYSEILQIGKTINPAEFETEIDNAREKGISLGGKFKIVYENLPVGLGSYVHYDRMLDGNIAQAVMSIPAIRSVSIGEGEECAGVYGDEFQDEMFLENNKIVRKTNNAGGIEGGTTNGEELVVIANMKPIPTMKASLNTVDLKTGEEITAHFERSDTCAIEACAVIAENKIACVLLDEFLLKFGGDSKNEITNRVKEQTS